MDGDKSSIFQQTMKQRLSDEIARCFTVFLFRMMIHDQPAESRTKIVDTCLGTIRKGMVLRFAGEMSSPTGQAAEFMAKLYGGDLAPDFHKSLDEMLAVFRTALLTTGEAEEEKRT